MGLGIALSNALSGMRAGQNGVEIVSRNIANSGVPGYHRQSLSVIDTAGVNSSYVRSGVVTRAFNDSLQMHFNRSLSDSGFTSVRANFVDRLQTVFGKPGTAGSLDTAFSNFQQSLSALSTSPDSYAVRAEAVSKAQLLAGTLNDLSSQVQSLRRETEARITNSVSDLNQMLGTLEDLNIKLSDHGLDESTRATLADQRDRLVSDVARVVDIRADYRPDGTVALMTRSGVGLLDGRASVFEFQSAGTISATSQFSVDADESGVGKLIVRTPAGLALDLVQQNVLKSGELAALVELRDKTLVAAQDQLDDVAAALAQSISTVETPGTAAPALLLPATGFDIDLAPIRNGNDFVLDYKVGNEARSIRVVRVDDTGKLPLDTTDAAGNRLVGLDFSGGAGSVASQLQTLLGGAVTVSAPGGTTLRVVDDGASNTTDITGLRTRHTVSATQDAGLALSLFVDNNASDFTNSLDGMGQKRGFAARISVNQTVISDSALMVQFTANGSLGDDDRADFLLDKLDNMKFATYGSGPQGTSYRLSGSVSDYITQTINFQGNVAASALANDETQQLTMQTLEERLDAEYGVDVDEEMARLMELQNAYAANARVLSTVQELLNQLMAI
jgi:flagellar hook-associated protein 1 FlgK